MGLMRFFAIAALQKLAGPEPEVPPRSALPASSSGLMRRAQQRQKPPMLRSVPVWDDAPQAMPPMVMPSAYLAPAPPPRRRRRKITVVEETFTKRRG